MSNVCRGAAVSEPAAGTAGIDTRSEAVRWRATAGNVIEADDYESRIDVTINVRGIDMRVKTFRTIAIALIFVLLDAPVLGYNLLPDIIGLPFIFICAVMMTDRAGRFARTAVVSAFMSFLEIIRIFKLTESEPVLNFLTLLYLFLTVLLVITVADGIAQFSLIQGQTDIANFCDMTGHIYALTFIFSAFSMWFTALSNIFSLINLIISIFALVMFTYFYSAIHVIAQQQFDPPALKQDDEPSQESESTVSPAGTTV